MDSHTVGLKAKLDCGFSLQRKTEEECSSPVKSRALQDFKRLPMELQTDLKDFHNSISNLTTAANASKATILAAEQPLLKQIELTKGVLHALHNSSNEMISKSEKELFKSYVSFALRQDISRQVSEAQCIINPAELHKYAAYQTLKPIALSTYRKYKAVENKMEIVAELIQKAERLISQPRSHHNIIDNGEDSGFTVFHSNQVTPIRRTAGGGGSQSNSKSPMKTPQTGFTNRSFSSTYNHFASTPQPAAMTPKFTSPLSYIKTQTPHKTGEKGEKGADAVMIQEAHIDTLLSRIDEDYLSVKEKITFLTLQIEELESATLGKSHDEDEDDEKESSPVRGGGRMSQQFSELKTIGKTPSPMLRGKYSLRDDESVESGDGDDNGQTGKSQSRDQKDEDEDEGYVFIGSSPVATAAMRKKKDQDHGKDRGLNRGDLSVEFEGQHGFNLPLADEPGHQRHSSPEVSRKSYHHKQESVCADTPLMKGPYQHQQQQQDTQSQRLGAASQQDTRRLNKAYWSHLSSRIRRDKRPNFSFTLFEDLTVRGAGAGGDNDPTDGVSQLGSASVASGAALITPIKSGPSSTYHHHSSSGSAVKVPSSWKKQLKLHYNYQDTNNDNKRDASTVSQQQLSAQVVLTSEQVLGDWRHVQPCLVRMSADELKTSAAAVGGSDKEEKEEVIAEEASNYVSPLIEALKVIDNYTAVTTVALKPPSTVAVKPSSALTLSGADGSAGTAAKATNNVPFGTTGAGLFGATGAAAQASVSGKPEEPISLPFSGAGGVGRFNKPRSDSVHSSHSVQQQRDDEDGPDRNSDHAYTGGTKSNSRGNSRSNSIIDSATFKDMSSTLTSVFDSETGTNVLDITKKDAKPSTATGAQPVDESSMSIAQLTEAITAIYRTHNPNKIDEIPKLLTKYKDREVELLRKIRQKYGISVPVPAPISTVGGTVTPSGGVPFKLEVLRSPDSTASPRASNTRSSSVLDLASLSGSDSKPPTATAAGGIGATTSLFGKPSSTASGTSPQTPFTISKQGYVGGTTTPILGGNNLFGAAGGGSGSAGGSLFATGTQSPFGEPKPAVGGSLFGGSAGAAGTHSPFTQQLQQPQQSPFGQSTVATATTPITSLSSLNDIAARVTQIYAQHNPSKLAEIPALLEKYRGKELQLIANLEKKYGAAAGGGTPPTGSVFGSGGGVGGGSLFGGANNTLGGTISPSTGLGSLFGVKPAGSAGTAGTQSPFGQQQQQVQASPFGQPQQTSPFGQQQQAQQLGTAGFRSNVVGGTTSPFGNQQQQQQPQTGGLFGNAGAGSGGTVSPFTQQKATPFGQPQSTGLFGNTSGGAGIGGTVSPFNPAGAGGGLLRGGSSGIGGTASPFGQSSSLLGTHVGGTVSPFRSSIGIATPGANITAPGTSLFGTSPGAAATGGGGSLFGGGGVASGGGAGFGLTPGFGGGNITPFGQQQQPQQSPFGQQQQQQQQHPANTATMQNIAARVTQIYTQHNPSKLAEIPALLEKYRGKELQLIANLEKKYGAAAGVGGQAMGGGFGQPQQQPQQFGQQTPFGGQQQQQTSPFGQNQQQQQAGGGSFGSPAAGGGGGALSMFNRSPAGGAFGGGGGGGSLFGQQPQQPQQSPFGQQPQQGQGSLFGQNQNQQGGGGGGGNAWGRGF